MKTFRIIICLFLFGVIFKTATFAQDEKYKNPVEVTTAHKIPLKLKVGDEITLIFNCKVEEGFHMCAAKMPPKKNPKKPQYMPAKLEMLPSATGYELIGELQDGLGVITEFDDVFENDMSFYLNNATFTQKIKITSDKPIIEGKLNYQVMSEYMGIFDNFEFTVENLKVIKKAE